MVQIECVLMLFEAFKYVLKRKTTTILTHIHTERDTHTYTCIRQNTHYIYINFFRIGFSNQLFIEYNITYIYIYIYYIKMYRSPKQNVDKDEMISYFSSFLC